MANKNTRILCAVLTRGERFDAHHVWAKAAGSDSSRLKPAGVG